MALKLLTHDGWKDVGSLYQVGEEAEIIVRSGYGTTPAILDVLTDSEIGNIDKIQFNVPVDTSINYLFSGTGITQYPSKFYHEVEDDDEEFPSYAPSVDLRRATSAHRMFYQCSSLTHVGGIDLSYATDTKQMFEGCSNLQYVHGVAMSRARSLYRFFYNCRELEFARLYDLGRINRVDGMFQNNTKLKHLELHGLGVVEPSSTISQRRLDVSMTSLDTDGMNTLAESLGDTSELTRPWILRYKQSVTFDTSIVTDKGWVLDPI